jgi:hypothetical protein
MSDFDSIDDNNKNNHQNESREEQEQQLINSPILATRYAHRSSKLIYSIEKNFYWIIGIIGILFILSLLDFLKMHDILPFSLDTPITIFSAISMAALGYTFRIILKSKRILESWADMFERNSIRAGMNISMASKSKEEAVHAIAETIEEIGEPLRKYLSSKDNFNEFLNVSVVRKAGNSSSSSDTDDNNREMFDVLIDADHVSKINNNIDDDSNNNNNNNNQISNCLIEALKEYGGIIIKIIDGTITNDIIASFSKQLRSYTSLTKNKVHLAIVIGDDASEEPYKLAIRSERRGRIDYFVLVEKPSSSSLFVYH